MIQIKNRYTGTVIWENKDIDTLSDAKLSYADLSGADLSGADLSGANLSGADLSGADLSGADLSYANLRDANLRGADLSGADLRDANLRRADLRRADLRDADLRGANLRGANLGEVKRLISFSCFGSANRQTYYLVQEDSVFCGCFKGSLEEFEQKVQETHENNPIHLAEYTAMIEMIRKLRPIYLKK